MSEPDHAPAAPRFSSTGRGRAAVVLGVLALTVAAPVVADDDWWRLASRELSRAEYRIARVPHGGATAANRAHGLRVRFASDGSFVLTDRTAAPSSWAVELRPNAPASRLSFTGDDDASHVLRVHGADRVDRWSNSPDGVRFEFVVAASGAGMRETATFEATFLVTSNGLETFAAPDGTRICFGAGRGPCLEASGPDPVGRFELDGDRLTVRSRPAGGTAPGFVVRGAKAAAVGGPSLTPDWIDESNRGSAELGATVAPAGDVNGDGYGDLIVGAPGFDNGLFREGRAAVYFGSPDGPAISPSWTVDGGQVAIDLGSAVAAAGDVNGDGFDDIVVGADQFDNVGDGEGRASLYLGSAAGPQATPVWSVEGGQALARLGAAVAAAGDVNGDGFADVLVGAPFFDDDQSEEGRVTLYLGSASGLGPGAVWFADGDASNAQLGRSVSGAGDVDGDGFDDVILGAPGYGNGQIQEGRAVLYLGGVAGLSAAPDWAIESDDLAVRLGESVSRAGDVNGDGFADVIVGVPLSNAGGFGSGAAQVYMGSPSGPSTVADLLLPGPGNDARFGESVATAGDVNGDGYADVVIGAPRRSDGESQEGTAFVYLGSAAGLSPTPAWSASSDRVSASFGESVATAGDVNGDGFSDVLVGAPGFDNGEFREGRIYVFFGSAALPGDAPSWSADGDVNGALFGSTVAHAGDIDGDGYGDVLVGAPTFDAGLPSEGAVFLYRGSPGGPSTVADWTAAGGQFSANFGRSVASAGDVDGDGFDDVIVGAPLFDGVNLDEGQAFVYRGSPAGLSLAPDWTAAGGQLRARFATAVAAAGDVNGDGFGDVLVGAPTHDETALDTGRAVLYLGSPSGPGDEPAWVVAGAEEDEQLGNALGSAGDVNGDGFSDVIVAASRLEGMRAQGGRVAVYYGSRSGLSEQPLWSASGGTLGVGFGTSVGSAGDVNGDGFADVIVGAPGFGNMQFNEGAAFVYFGSPIAISTTPDWLVEGSSDGARAGASVAAAGDVDLDGYGDVLIGAPDQANGEIREGRISLYRGGPAGPSSVAAWSWEPNLPEARVGSAVAGAGDVNGDGFADVLTGAPFLSDDQSLEGRAYMIMGGGGGGVDRRLGQRRLDGTPIARLGRADSDTTFGLVQLARSAAGRTRVRLEWQTAPVGEPFLAAVGRQATSSDSGPPDASGSAVELDAIAGGLDAGRRFCDNGVRCLTDDDCVGIGSGVCNVEAVPFHRWRARIASDDPYFQRTPWTSIAGNSLSETKLRSDAPLPAPRFRVAGPGSNESVFPDTAPVTFGWDRGLFRDFAIEWSRNPQFDDPLERVELSTHGAGEFRVFVPDPELWTRILALGQTLDFRGAPVFWRILPLDGSVDPDSLEFRVLRVTSPEPPTLVSPAEGASIASDEPPTLVWQSNHNARYRIRFAATPAIGWPRVDSGPGFDLVGTNWSVPAAIWAEVVDLSGLSADGRVHWVVLAEDALGRQTFSRAGSVVVVDGSATAGPATARPKAGRGSGRRLSPRPRLDREDR